MSTSFESELMKLLDEHKDEIIQIRRYLHEYPNYLFIIKNYYKGLDCQVRDCGDGYGIVVDINADKPGKKLAWRADFYALPIQEDNDLPFKSQNPGVMHANGSIRLIHQPAEEVAPGGALSTIKEMTLMMFAVFTL